MYPTPAYIVNAAYHLGTLERKPRNNKAVLTCRASEDLRAHPKAPEDFECLIDTETAPEVYQLRTIQTKMHISKTIDLTVIELGAADTVHELRRTQPMILWEIDALKRLMEGDEASWVYSHVSSSLPWICVNLVARTGKPKRKRGEDYDG
ncbi:uncharacterized protein LAJ45_03572 [Morchella importuna]|uniref:uncharacterized protein n=1 Tax=Morchella importuna TaxID=1174673 RepID=UPI001E8E9847|nr:uncharacterized protein LAJ45_03572 [Morchella importuna]KAH8152146.1 hypothetical protein LAJ45_03572 [Morchella importuna]